MKGFIKIGVAFIAGLAVGAVAFKKYVETKYDFIDDNEEEKTETPQIEEEKPEDPVEEQEETIEEIEDLSDRYEEILSEMMYKHEKECEEVRELLGDNFVSEPFDPDKPYRISSDDYGADGDYDGDEYTYFADGYLTDSTGIPMNDMDIERTVGIGFAEYFDDDSVDEIYIRNERLKMEFSIVRDLDRFEDVAPPRIRRLCNLETRGDW